MSEPTIIHIVWSDPIPLATVGEFVSDATDFGLYAIYGNHPIHGNNALLYIGRCLGGSFGWEVPRKQPKFDNPKVEAIHVRLGRLAGVTTPSDDAWNREIELAERLLIFAHQPPLNVKRGLGAMESVLQSIHVCNWGLRGDILPEVSGLRWTAQEEAITKNIYDTKGRNPSVAPN
jgi:hypothetical protein